MKPSPVGRLPGFLHRFPELALPAKQAKSDRALSFVFLSKGLHGAEIERGNGNRRSIKTAVRQEGKVAQVQSLYVDGALLEFLKFGSGGPARRSKVPTLELSSRLMC
jgi:hypothetical protein